MKKQKEEGCIKKGPDGDATPQRNLSYINDKNLSFRDS